MFTFAIRWVGRILCLCRILSKNSYHECVLYGQNVYIKHATTMRATPNRCQLAIRFLLDFYGFTFFVLYGRRIVLHYIYDIKSLPNKIRICMSILLKLLCCLVTQLFFGCFACKFLCTTPQYFIDFLRGVRFR